MAALPSTLPAPVTAQEVARARRSTEAKTPLVSNGDLDSDVAEMATSSVAVPTGVVPDTGSEAAPIAAAVDEPPLVAKSAFVKIGKTVMTFNQDGYSRKFYVKDYGTPHVTLSVAEEFSRHISQIRIEFDQLSKKPEQRHTFLQKFGWPADRCSKRKLKDQLSFVLSAVCEQKWPQLEAHLLLTGLGLSKKGCTLTHSADGFKARVTPAGGTTIEKTFESLSTARKWIAQVMSVED